ncbi:U32 family peptidase [Pelagicoccus sp. NFK12]|uniref:U32 family peptidase n=1 Tax=Pelagicoccus enzymogenes TaxID=2773457 RepID=A0A927IFD0_9BACT|nr:U32 family peptidase [Pelagicoccus enzymogenes]MBD5777976.1 U32 family peptidase [Pelagicoccus enzymogenes]
MPNSDIPATDALVRSEKRFADGAQYRIEIPSTETPKAFRVALEEADKIGCPIHRVSQGSGIQMLSDDDMREYAKIGADRAIEVCLFTTPRAGFDIGGMWNAPAGKFIQWQVRGSDQLRYSLDEVKRAVDLGIRSFLLADIGLIEIVSELRAQGQLPSNLIIKSSAVIAPANPASCRILERIGSDTINVATDLTIQQLSAIRQVVSAPIDMYVEAPDGLGGFVRHHETPDMITFAAPLYVKLGLRNSPDIYPYGGHLENLALSLTRERVRRSKLVYDLIQRQAPEAIISATNQSHADLAVPATQ